MFFAIDHCRLASPKFPLAPFLPTKTGHPGGVQSGHGAPGVAVPWNVSLFVSGYNRVFYSPIYVYVGMDQYLLIPFLVG